MSGATVNFTVDGGAAGSAVTDGSGVAIFTHLQSIGALCRQPQRPGFIHGCNDQQRELLGQHQRHAPIVGYKSNTDALRGRTLADITYGTALSGTQLNATASVRGIICLHTCSGDRSERGRRAKPAR